MANRRKLVTNGKWNVSTMTGHGIDGAVLHVSRRISDFKSVPGDANGMLFASSEEAREYALSRGYLKEYVIPWCLHCRAMHHRKHIRNHAGKLPKDAYCPVTDATYFG